MAESTVQPKLPYRIYSNPNESVRALITALNDQFTRVSDELDTVLAPGVDPGNVAPTNSPTPTGITVTTAADGSMDVNLTWNYTQGLIPAEMFILYWKEGLGSLSAPTASDKTISIPATATNFTFKGWNPNSNYRFGIAAGRTTVASAGIVAGTIQAPTAAPDWADIASTGNYNANINGTSATTVVNNAANGQTAYTGTLNYRTTGAPTNSITPVGISSTLNEDASADYTILFDYVQGGRQADGFLVFVLQGNATPAVTDPHYLLGRVNATVNFTIKGLTPEVLYSFGVAAFRRTESGLEVGSIVGSTSAPDWTGISSGSPNYVGTVWNLEQHNFSVHAGGVGLLDTALRYAQVTRDGVVLQNGARSYNLYVWDLSSQAAVFSQTYDIFTTSLWCNTLARDISAYQGRLLYSVFTFANTIANNFLYVDMTNVADYTVGATASDYYLVYDVSWAASGNLIALDLECSDGTTLRASAAVDQNGRSCHPATSIPDGSILNTWYRRRIQLPASFNSKTITRWMLVCEKNSAGTHVGAIRGAMISTADTRDPCLHPIWIGYTESVSLTEISDADTNSLVVGPRDTPTRTTDILIVSTQDEPQTNRLTGNLTNALVSIGASRTLFTSDSFQFGSAYILVGQPNIGEGNGLERYAGKTSSDLYAYADLAFQTQDSQIIALTGTGWDAVNIPGVPTNNPAPTGVTNSATDTGQQRHLLSWTYSQPTLTGDNRLADGFILYYESGSTSNPGDNYIKLAIGATDFTFEWAHDLTVSYAIAAYRKTSSGVEIGTKQTTASWQGVSSAGLILTAGITDSNVTTNKIADSNVTTNKVNNNAVTTAKRQVSNTQSAGYTISHGAQQVQQFSHSIGAVPLATAESGDSGIAHHIYAVDSSKIWFNKVSLYTPAGSISSTFVVYYW